MAAPGRLSTECSLPLFVVSPKCWGRKVEKLLILIISYVGRQGNSDRYTDEQVWGSPHTGAKIAFGVGIVEPNSNSHSARSGCNQSFFNVNAGTRDEEREKVKRYTALCNQRGLTFVPIIFTTCGGMKEAFHCGSYKSGTLTGRGSRQRTLR